MGHIPVLCWNNGFYAFFEMGYSSGIFFSPAEIPLELLAYLLVMPRILLAYARISLEYSRNSFFTKGRLFQKELLEFLIWANTRSSRVLRCTRCQQRISAEERVKKAAYYLRSAARVLGRLVRGSCDQQGSPAKRGIGSRRALQGWQARCGSGLQGSPPGTGQHPCAGARAEGGGRPTGRRVVPPLCFIRYTRYIEYVY